MSSSVLMRVSVLGAHTQLDVGLPAHVPIAALLPTLVTRVESRNPLSSSVLTPLPPPPPDPRRWVLSRVGHEPLPTELSLFDAGVRDGDLLTLAAADDIGSAPLFDDIVEAVAEYSRARARSWSPTLARRLGWVTSLVAVAICAWSLILVQVREGGWWPSVVAALGSMALLATAKMVVTHRRDPSTAAVATWASIILAVAAGAAVIPGQLGPATLLLGALAAGCTSALAHRLIGVSPMTHSGICCASVLVTSAAIAGFIVAAPIQIAATTAAAGLLVVVVAPRLAATLAKLPLPPVPTAGEPIDVTDDVSTIDGVAAVGPISLPLTEILQRRTVLTQEYLTGITVSAAFVAATAAFLAASSWHHIDLRTVTFLGVVASVLMLRGRSHTDAVQAGSLVSAGVAAVLAGTIALLCNPTVSPTIGFATATIILGGSIACGLIAPGRTFSPVSRRSVELVEYSLIVVLIPLLLWILDLYSVVRSLR